METLGLGELVLRGQRVAGGSGWLSEERGRFPAGRPTDLR